MASGQGLHIRFKKLVLQGFKSFPDRTVLEFGNHLCAIVGPNGCGKSNILDALRWVLGEQSALQLRGRSMQDVIFNGSAKRRPLGMAEVSLTISQPSGTLPIGYEEIEITRRLYRSGESEYRLNRSPCRLKDITELFLDSGVGKGAYALIEQGRVDALLTAHPMERRGLLEQVAGIRKYKERKKEALSKLASAEHNLERVRDVMGEVKSRRISLARQASRAEKYRLLMQETAELSRMLLAARYAHCKLDVSRIDTETEQLENRMIRLKTEMSLSAAAVQKAAVQVNAVGGDLRIVRREAEQLEYRIDYLEKRLSDLAARERELTTERDAAGAEVAELSQRRTALRVRKEELKQQRQADLKTLEQLETQRKALEKDIAGIDETIQQHRRRLDELKKIYLQAMARAAETRNRRTKTEEAVRRVRSRMEALDREYRNMRFEEGGLEAESDGISARLTSLENRQAELKEKIETAGARCRDRRRVADELKGRLREVEARLLETGSRLRSLREIVAAGEGLGEGVKAILQEYARRREDHDEIVGVLADLYETEPAYEKALAAALEARIQDVVVRDSKPVPDALAFLSGEQRGRCTFTPVSPRRVNGHKPPEHLPETARPLLELVRTSPEYAPLFKQLLRRTYLVESLDDAFEAWKSEPTPVTLVTTAGEMVGPDGAVTGGIEKAGKTVYRARKQEITLLEAELNRMKKRRETLSTRHENAVAALEKAEEEKRLLEKEMSEVRLALAEVRRDMEHMARRLKHARLRREAVETERMLLETELKELNDTWESLRAESETASPEDPVAEDMQRLEKQLESDRNAKDERRNRLSDLKVQIGSIKGKITSSMREERQAEDEDQRLLALSLRLKKRAAEVTLLLEQLQEERENLTGEMTALLDKRPVLKTRMQVLEQRLHREKEAEAALSRDLRKQETESHALEKELMALETRKAEAESVMATLREQFRGDLAAAAGDLRELPDEAEMNAWKTRLETLEQKLATYTDVNLAAEEEHRKLVERSKFLEEQVTDLEESIRSLRATIKHINQTIRTRFMDAFENVNRYFGEIFRDLFEGGEASLKLSDPDDPLESGVLITCRPPGKRARSIDLMSGGEKALTALALLLAGFKYRPSPIIFLDEVDAPLDDINVARFTRYLKKLAADTQVMMVTHNAVTMEVADVLYGVTMAEAGVSRLITAKLAVA